MFVRSLGVATLSVGLFAAPAGAQSLTPETHPTDTPSHAFSLICLPLAFQGVSCHKGKAVANFASCRPSRPPRKRILEQSDSLVAFEQGLSFQLMKFRRTLTELEKIVGEIETAEQQASLKGPDRRTQIVTASMLPVFHVAIGKLREDSKLCDSKYFSPPPAIPTPDIGQLPPFLKGTVN